MQISSGMRVPDITLTAGNAAQFAHINNLTEQSQSTTFTGAAAYATARNELNKNNDWTRRQCQTTTTGRFNFLPTDQYSNSSAAYTSSADEFVQRALSSSIAVPYEYNTPTLAGAHGYGHYYQSHSQTQNYLENYGSNSNSAYKGFQEVYVNRAAIALDDYEKANYVREQEEYEETHGVGASSSARLGDYQYAHNDMKLDLGANTQHELNSNHQEEFINHVGTEEYARVGNPDPEHDYNDQSMLDLCNDTEHKSAVEQHNDELDEYLTSPTSSSVSLTAPHRSYFPRGIVNPNYPGFQHLAHTLSEHFIGCTPTDSHDSDMSECEMELSGDSCDDLSNDEQQSELNMKMNIYNNNSNSNDSHKRESEERLESAELSNSAQQKQHVESYTDANSNSAINSNNETSEDQQQQQQHQLQQQHNKLGALIANELHENLRQLLTLNVPDNYTDAYIINSADQFPFRYDQKCRLVAQIDGETPPPPVYGTTPDILLKNSNVRQEQQSKSKENRPDLLRGVSPQPLRKHVETGRIEVPGYESVVGSKQETGLKRNSLAVNAINSTATTPVRSSDLVRDDGVGFGITPVDIIGDFEQEVEREFGLLVSGYRRLVEATNDDTNEIENEVGEPQAIGKVSDAMLSSAKDLIDSDKYVNALQQNKEGAVAKVETKTASAVNMMDFMEDNNAVDWSYGRCGDSEEMHSSQARGESDDHKLEDITDVSTVSNTNSAQIRPKYQKPSYDERQLPPVAIEYKRCQQSIRSARKSPGLMNHEKSEKATKPAGGSKIARNHTKGNLANRFFNSRRTNVGCSVGSRLNDKSADSMASRRREEAEIHQYQELISNKEQISSNSRYAKMSGWSQHVKSTVKNHGGKYANSELASPSALELFDAYKIGGDFDKETLQKHLKLAKEIEKKRRSDREEIRRRLAMGADENSPQSNERAVWKAGIQSRAANAQLGRLNDPASDTESHSSDSETCPKLSKTKVNTDNASALNVTLADKPTYPYAGNGRGAPLSSHGATSQSTNMKAQQAQQNLETTLAVAISSEDMECDFFTKQAKLQIEARMALAQAKEMAHMQMEIERQHRRTSPITDIIRVSLRKVGVQMSEDKRRLSRLMLTDMNIAQLQVLVNSLHTHIEDLNESLVHNLMERDDLHVSQDSMLVDIEELTRYIGANEHLAQRYKNPNLYNHK